MSRFYGLLPMWPEAIATREAHAIRLAAYWETFALATSNGCDKATAYSMAHRAYWLA